MCAKHVLFKANTGQLKMQGPHVHVHYASPGFRFGVAEIQDTMIHHMSRSARATQIEPFLGALIRDGHHPFSIALAVVTVLDNIQTKNKEQAEIPAQTLKKMEDNN